MRNNSSNNNENKKKELIPRIYKRFKAKDGSFALLWPHFNKRGQIIDISSGGLSFHYVASEEESNASSEMDILIVEDGFYIDRIPFYIIYDFEISKESSQLTFQMRRLGVKFRELNPEQISKLEFFISNYTEGEV